ncbi:MAG: M48 family metallopeptidase [Burkholderiales bacterium]|nr:M48 family metallopeptidase [Burkholderiales bacterium]
MQLELPLALAPAAAPAGSLRYIQLGGEVVGYRFRRARRRSIGMVIDDEGLRVAAPGHTSIAEVEAFIREKARWVLRKLSEWRAAPRPQVVNWSDGATIALLGVPVTIELVPGRRDISLHDGRLGIGLASRGEPAALRKRAIAWIKERARALFGERLSVYAARLGVPTPALALSSARLQWGQCREDGRVRLNWRLIHLPLHLVDYVVAHELAHLREMNHSARFWAVVGGLYPDYLLARRELRESSHRLPIL